MQWRGPRLPSEDDPVVVDLNAVSLRELGRRIMEGQLDDRETQMVATHWRTMNAPDSVIMNDPEAREGRGRPKKKSNAREKSSFEHNRENMAYAREERNRRASQGSTQGNGPKPRQGRARRQRSVPPKFPPIVVGGYDFGQDNFESFMVPFVTWVRNVSPDGNCGFRALAVLLGATEDAWPQIRMSMMSELSAHPYRYMTFMEGQIVDEVYARLHWFNMGVNAPEAHWMEMPICGALFATIYQCTLVYLDWFGAHTSLPVVEQPPALGSPPPDSILVLCRDRHSHHFLAVHLSTFLWCSYFFISI